LVLGLVSSLRCYSIHRQYSNERNEYKADPRHMRFLQYYRICTLEKLDVSLQVPFFVFNFWSFHNANERQKTTIRRNNTQRGKNKKFSRDRESRNISESDRPDTNKGFLSSPYLQSFFWYAKCLGNPAE
jgi:hypothetical protein